MLRPLRAFALSLVLPLLTGCSTHPLPEDVTRKTTFDIVKKMRCEVREGIFEAAIDDERLLKRITIGFDFKFIISEDADAAGGDLKLVNPVGGGTFSLNFKATADKLRKNERTFRVLDTFQMVRDDQGCDEAWQRANFVYPMTGRVGLDETVVTFVKIRKMTNFRKLKADSTDLFTDKLDFITTFTAGVSPNLSVDAPTIGGLKLTNVKIDGSVGRTDNHSVTIAIAVEDEVPKNASGRRAGGLGIQTFANDTPSAVPGPEITTDDSAASRVINELNRQRFRDDLRDFPTLRPLE